MGTLVCFSCIIKNYNNIYGLPASLKGRGINDVGKLEPETFLYPETLFGKNLGFRNLNINYSDQDENLVVKRLSIFLSDD